MILDFETKSRPAQIVSTRDEKNAKFLAINHSPISFDREAYKGKKPTPTRFTLLRPISSGWSSAPYKKNQKGVRTSKLSEMAGGPQPAVRFYSFQKVSNNMEKGPRCDDISFELRAGNVLNFWLDEKRLDDVKRIIDKDITKIDPFTVCEIQISPNNNEAVGKGYGCKIATIKICDFTLYSCVAVSVCVPVMALFLH
jgi:hypothetical protein